VHAYGFFIDEAKLTPLIDDIPIVYSTFKREIYEYISKK
jgi:hypothetical protein